MPYKIPTLDETRSFLLALGKALFPTLNFGSLRSYHGRRTTFLSAAVTELHAQVDSVQRDVHPLTAGDGKPINDWGGATGVIRKSATPARKSAAGRVSGAGAATASSGATLRHDETGLLFALNQDVAIPGSTTAYVDADIVAIDTGVQTRLTAGQVLKFVSTPVGIETSVVLQLDLDEDGFDSEQFGSYRSRVLSTFSQTPSGGNQADFVKWALASLNAVATAYAYPNRAGRGTIDVVAFSSGTGTSRSLSSDDRALVAQYIRTKSPFQIAGTGGPLRILETVADPQSIEIVLSPSGQAAYAFDWDQSGGPTVAAWTEGTRELTFTPTPLPASLRAGHRLILAGGDHDGREYKIESISDVATGKVILEKVPVATVLAAQLIYSGGPLVTPVRDAIVAHLNGQTVYAGRGQTPLPASAVASAVGLDVLAEGVGSANPAGLYGTWTGAIILATLSKIATYKRGVRNAVIVAPVADYEATDDVFPNDGQIHYVTPGAVVVRGA